MSHYQAIIFLPFAQTIEADTPEEAHAQAIEEGEWEDYSGVIEFGTGENTPHLVYELDSDSKYDPKLVYTNKPDDSPDSLKVLKELVANNYGQPSGVYVPALDTAREIIANYPSPDSPDLLAILAECITEDGAACMSESGTASEQVEALDRRIKYINEIAGAVQPIGGG